MRFFITKIIKYETLLAKLPRKSRHLFTPKNMKFVGKYKQDLILHLIFQVKFAFFTNLQFFGRTLIRKIKVLKVLKIKSIKNEILAMNTFFMYLLK